MRIALFTDTFLRQVNGVVVAVVELAKSLADRGHKVYIFAPRIEGGEEFSYPNVVVKLCPSVPALIYEDYKFTLPFDPWVLNFVRSERIDVIHFNTPIMLGLQAIITAKILKLPLVGTFHTFFAEPEYLKHVRLNNKAMEKVAWKFAHFYYKYCDLISCPSEGTKAVLLEKKWKVPLKVIPYGVKSSAFDNSKAKETRKRFNSNGKLLLTVSRITYEKNIPFILEAFHLVLQKEPNVKLVIVGGGPQMPEVKERIKQLGLEKSVILTGHMLHNELVKSSIFGACDIFVMASKTETGPIAMIEAQINGLVCVGMKGKGMKLIENGINGYEVNPGDMETFTNRVIELLTNDAKYEAMRRATLKGVKQYELSHIAKVWEETYEELIAAKKQRKAITLTSSVN